MSHIKHLGFSIFIHFDTNTLKRIALLFCGRVDLLGKKE